MNADPRCDRWVQINMIELAKRMPMIELLARQDQLIRRDQALAAGLTRAAIDRHLRSGRWRRVLPTVYLTQPPAQVRTAGSVRLADGPNLTEGQDPAELPNLADGPNLTEGLGWARRTRRRIRATWMWAGDQGVICGAAAAFWAGHLANGPAVTEVIVTPSRRLSGQPEVAVLRSRLDRRDMSLDDGILITAPHRTALDLAAEGRNELLDRLAQRGRLHPAGLQAALDRGAHRRGWTRARTAVGDSLTNPHSEAERLTHRALLAARITGWRANCDLLIQGHVIQPDLLFDDVKLVVEIDGYAYHSDRAAFERDRWRQNLLIAQGWTVLRFTWRQVLDGPAAVVAQIEQTRHMLRARSG